MLESRERARTSMAGVAGNLVDDEDDCAGAGVWVCSIDDGSVGWDRISSRIDWSCRTSARAVCTTISKSLRLLPFVLGAILQVGLDEFTETFDDKFVCLPYNISRRRKFNGGADASEIPPL